MTNSNIAIYPGSFDPITNGHVDLVKRTLRVFDRVIIAIASNPDKDRSLFTVEERLQMINEVFAELKGRAEADSFQGLLVDYAERKGSTVIIRGLRAVSDFEYEFQMAGMNRGMYPDVETLFMTPSEQYMFISATIVREIASLGGKADAFVHPLVAQKLREKITK